MTLNTAATAVAAAGLPGRPGLHHRRGLRRVPRGLRPPSPGTPDGRPMVEVSLHVHGRYPVSELAAALSEIEDVDAILVGTASAAGE